MNKPLFMHIVDRLSNEVQFFRQKKDGLRRLGISTLQKCIAAIRVLAYGSALDAVDEYLRLGATATRLCVENFVEAIIDLFGDQYLRRPTQDDLQRLLHIGELRLQEAARKDVERAFGVLQTRFPIVKNPALSWDKVKIGKIMRAYIILHSMIVENERDDYTQYEVSDFQQGEGSGSSHIDLTYSTDIPTNIANQIGVRTRICDRQAHQQLKCDFVEHI
uniref:Uncharacterized protein n=1 Tax=Brassica oleracea var. oleracea TaxID=109376 RepID=A0A0D3D414_BRAOL